jgi:bifunctional non-homologous end joining protein LigD
VAAEIAVNDAILDGEVIVADGAGRPQFYDLLRGTRAPAYVAFDLLWLDGTDLRSLPLSERRRRLQTILPARAPAISEALSVEGRGCELFELMRAHDLEGIVAKRLADPYDRRTRWLKIKNPDYTQQEGRGDLLNRPSQRRAASGDRGGCRGCGANDTPARQISGRFARDWVGTVAPGIPMNRAAAIYRRGSCRSSPSR